MLEHARLRAGTVCAHPHAGNIAEYATCCKSRGMHGEQEWHTGSYSTGHVLDCGSALQGCGLSRCLTQAARYTSCASWPPPDRPLAVPPPAPAAAAPRLAALRVLLPAAGAQRSHPGAPGGRPAGHAARAGRDRQVGNRVLGSSYTMRFEGGRWVNMMPGRRG